MKRIALLILFVIIFISWTFKNSNSKENKAKNRINENTLKRTQIVLLGTGTPNPDPNRSGPSVAIVVNDTPYIIDFGPGVVRRASAAYRAGVKGLAVPNLKIAFATHLHSDHTVGYPDLIFTPWIMGS